MLKIFHKKEQKGFTLIDLIMTILIIGILAAIAVPQFLSYREKAYNTQAKSELKSFYTACKAYFSDHPNITTCSTALIAVSFIPSGEVNIGNIPANQTLVGTTSFHVAGTSTYIISASENITP
jgi:type IV pilus assembly protein PilA